MSVASLTEALFKLPHRSNYRMPFHVQGTYAMGPIYPQKAIEMNPGDSMKINMQSLTRSNALKYPTMCNVRKEYHSFFVPFRILGNHYDDAFNLAIDAANRPALPVMDFETYAICVSQYGFTNLKSSLLDQFDYPVFSELINWILANSVFQSSFDKVPNASDTSSVYISNFDVSGYFGDSVGTDVITNPNIPSFNRWLKSVSVYNNAANEAYYAGLISGTVNVDGTAYYKLSGSSLAQVISSFVGKSSGQIFEEYLNSIIARIMSDIFENFSDSDKRGKPIDFLSIWAYWRIIYDWYINTNIDQNVDTWDEWCIANFGLNLDNWTPSYFISNPTQFAKFVTPAERLFSSDYFTSAFLSTQSGSAVPIPSGGTLIDLRSAESEQTFREKLLYSGRRTIDQNRTIFGVVSSDARFDRAEILGSQKFLININSVSQTSQSTDIDNSLGVLGGQGYGSGSRKNFVRYRAEERGLIIILLSYKPETLYSGVVDRLNLKTSVFDFLIPDFENVGEQGIYQQELSYIPYPNAADDVFGFNRRFAEYMFINSGVHGAMKTSLNFLTLSRSFTGKPGLNSDFIRIKPQVSGFNDMFVASEEGEQFNNWSFFEVYCTRPLSRFIEYGF